MKSHRTLNLAQSSALRPALAYKLGWVLMVLINMHARPGGRDVSFVGGSIPPVRAQNSLSCLLLILSCALAMIHVDESLVE